MSKTAILFSLGTVLALGACGETDEQLPGAPDAPLGHAPDALVGSQPDSGSQSGADAPTTQASGWRKLDLPTNDPSDTRVTAIHCTTVANCVVGTEVFNDTGNIYAATNQAVGAVVVTGDDALQTAHVVGHLGFLGFEDNHGTLVARLDALGAIVSATGDFTKPASWSIVSTGRDEGETFPLNAQEAIRDDGNGHWLLIGHLSYVYGASADPAAGTTWTKLWSPTAEPSVPADFEQRHEDDSTLCDSDVSTSQVPTGTQNVYISDGLAMTIFPAHGLNQDGSALPGVCISTDRGVTFFNVPFDGLNQDVDPRGPTAVTCLDKDRCWAFSGLFAQAASAYVMYTDNASSGKGSTWHHAILPAAIAASDEVTPFHMFFAPDGMHGWLAGSNNAHAMLLRTTDAGHTWTDVSAAVQDVADEKLHVGFAIDADHIFVGGANGTLLATDQASH